METYRRSKKRKLYTLPSDPFERIYIRRRRNNELNNDLRSVKDLRSRRVFSPASISEVKASIEGAKNDNYKVGIIVEGNQKNSAIDDTKSKLDLGIGQEDKGNGGIAEIVEKEVQSNLGICGKNQRNGELLQSPNLYKPTRPQLLFFTHLRLPSIKMQLSRVAVPSVLIFSRPLFIFIIKIEVEKGKWMTQKNSGSMILLLRRWRLYH